MISATRHLRGLVEDVLWRLVYEVTGHVPRTTGVVRVQAYLLLRYVIMRNIRMVRVGCRDRAGIRFWYLMNQVFSEPEAASPPPWAAGIRSTCFFLGNFEPDRFEGQWVHVTDTYSGMLRAVWGDREVPGFTGSYYDAGDRGSQSARRPRMFASVWPHGRLSLYGWVLARVERDDEDPPDVLPVTDAFADNVLYRPVRVDGEGELTVPRHRGETMDAHAEHVSAWAHEIMHVDDYWYVLCPWAGTRSTRTLSRQYMEPPSSPWSTAPGLRRRGFFTWMDSPFWRVGPEVEAPPPLEIERD